MLPAFDLLDLQPTDDPHRFRLAARKGCARRSGSCTAARGIAASIEAAERATGRPLQWITTQFIGTPVPDDVVDLEVTMPAHGRATTQAQVSATVDGRPMFTSLCAHTERPSGDGARSSTCPRSRRREDCPSMSEPFAAVLAGTFFDHLERRLAAGKDRHRGDRQPAGRPAGDVVPDPRPRDRQPGDPGVRRRHHPARRVRRARGDARRHEHRQHPAGRSTPSRRSGCCSTSPPRDSTARSVTARCASGARTAACSASLSRPASSAPATTPADTRSQDPGCRVVVGATME